MEWNGIDVELWIDRRRIYQTTTTCFTHGILFCILLAFPIERLYYALLAASNANFHDAFIIPIILFTIFYHSPQESFVIKNECEVFVVFCGITTRSKKNTFSVPLAQLADLNGECFLLKNKIFPKLFWYAKHIDLREKDNITLKRHYVRTNTTLLRATLWNSGVILFKSWSLIHFLC